MPNSEQAKDQKPFLEISCVENEIKLYSMNLNLWKGNIKDKLINLVLSEEHLRQALFDTIILNSEWRREFYERANAHSNRRPV